MSWTRSALLVSFTAATLAGVSALVVQAHEDGAFTTACYAALADDLTPLIDPNGGADSDVGLRFAQQAHEAQKLTS